ncbi:chloride channel protein [Candidatus Binatia bacterium]|nr:chloride channel protein [Candidatus Binatia bacterium]
MGGESQPDRNARPRPGLVRRALVLLVVPALVGTVTGACVAGASWLVEGRALKELALLPGALPAVPSLVALLATLLVVRFVTRVDRPATAEVYIDVFHHPAKRIALRELPGRVLAAAVTVSGGGSQGLESPSALLGAVLGQELGERLPRLDEHERRTWMIAGASAGIAAVFSSPAVGTMYGIEVPYRRDADLTRLVPAAVAAGAAYLTRAALVGPSHLVVLSRMPQLDAGFALACALVALGCGAGAWSFAYLTDLLRGLGRKAGPIPRALLGGIVLAGLAWAGHALAGSWITFGPGYVAAGWLASGEHAVGLLVATMLIRTAGTLACVFGAGGGGVFTSLAVTGVFVGEIVSAAMGRGDSNFLPLLGGACFLAAGYRIPLAGILMVAEATGSLTLTVIGLCSVGLAQVLMGDESVSDAKRDTRADAEALA